jgi:hypothetical protein
MSDPSQWSRLTIRGHYDEEGEILDLDFSWEGTTDLVAMTFDLVEFANPAWMQPVGLEKMSIGTEVHVGPFALEVIEIDQAHEVVVMRRLSDVPA